MRASTHSLQPKSNTNKKGSNMAGNIVLIQKQNMKKSGKLVSGSQ
jgi:hypothetical protein